MNQVFWRVAGRMACFMAMNQDDIYEHLLNINATFALDEEIILLAFSLLHRYIQVMGTKLVLKSDAEYMYVFFVCITIALKTLLDDGDAASLNLALLLGLGCAKLKANQMKVFESIGFNVFLTSENMIELGDILPYEDWQKLSFASYRMIETPTLKIRSTYYFLNEMKIFELYSYFAYPLQLFQTSPPIEEQISSSNSLLAELL